MAKVTELTARVLNVLRDVHWNILGESKIHDFLYEAEVVVVEHKPDATAKNIDFACAAGARQDLSALTNPAVSTILDVYHNGPAATPGNIIRQVDRKQLDLIVPGWHSATAADEADEFCYSENEKRILYLSPPAKAGNIINLSVSAVPAAYGVVDGNTETTVRDMYSPALVEWALYRCFQDGQDGGSDLQRSQLHLNNCSNMLGVKLQNELRTSLKRGNANA